MFSFYCYLCGVLFILSWNINEVFTYNHMALMYLRPNNLFIQHYIRSLIIIILRPILMIRTIVLNPIVLNSYKYVPKYVPSSQ